MFEVQFVRPACSGNAKIPIFEHKSSFLSPLRFIRVIRGENPIMFLTADSTDFTDKVAGKSTQEASILRCPANQNVLKSAVPSVVNECRP
jgi:hypothetical protein